MAIDPKLLAQLILPLISRAIEQRNAAGIPTAGVPIYSLQNDIVNNNLDPLLMLDAAKENGMRGYEDEFLNLNKIAPSNWMIGAGGGGNIGGILNPQKVISASDDTIQKIYDEAQENYYGNAPATALQSAVSMLRQNPKIGTANDPNMLPYQSVWEGLPSEVYESAPRRKADMFEEGSPYDVSDLVSDDDPIDQKAKIFKRLIKGY